MTMENLMQNKEFLAKLEALDNKADLQALLQEYGVTVTLAEIEKLAEEFSAELGEDALADVDGGVTKLPRPSDIKRIWDTIRRLLKK